MKQEKALVGHFKSKVREIINESDIETVILDASNQFLNRISDWKAEGVGGLLNLLTNMK